VKSESITSVMPPGGAVQATEPITRGSRPPRRRRALPVRAHREPAVHDSNHGRITAEAHKPTKLGPTISPLMCFPNGSENGTAGCGGAPRC